MKYVSELQMLSDEELSSFVTFIGPAGAARPGRSAPVLPFKPVFADSPTPPENQRSKRAPRFGDSLTSLGPSNFVEKLATSARSRQTQSRRTESGPEAAKPGRAKTAPTLTKEVEMAVMTIGKAFVESLALGLIDEGGVLDDPLGVLQEKIEKLYSLDNLVNFGLDQALDLLSDPSMDALGLSELLDSDPASAHIAQHMLQGYVLPEIKSFLNQQALSLLKDALPDLLTNLNLAEQKDVLTRLKEALGMESTAGCVPIALKYDRGTHKGAITSACATTVVAGSAEIPVARQTDGFSCEEDAVTTPVSAGIGNILAEGLPITAHEMKIGCGARIIASAGHDVYVLDAHPEVNLPLNDLPECPSGPQGTASAQGVPGEVGTDGAADARRAAVATDDAADAEGAVVTANDAANADGAVVTANDAADADGSAVATDDDADAGHSGGDADQATSEGTTLASETDPTNNPSDWTLAGPYRTQDTAEQEARDRLLSHRIEKPYGLDDFADDVMYPTPVTPTDFNPSGQVQVKFPVGGWAGITLGVAANSDGTTFASVGVYAGLPGVSACLGTEMSEGWQIAGNLGPEGLLDFQVGIGETGFPLDGAVCISTPESGLAGSYTFELPKPNTEPMIVHESSKTTIIPSCYFDPPQPSYAPSGPHFATFPNPSSIPSNGLTAPSCQPYSIDEK